MGYILPEIYQSICADNNYSLPKIFIETGTFKGGIPHRILETYGSLDNYFEQYFTIELGLDICQIASQRYRYFEQGQTSKEYIHSDVADKSFSGEQEYFNGKLTLINDDSVAALHKLLPSINDRCCFWLDAHAGAQKYARGTIDVPLLQELDAIKLHSRNDNIIAIDDAHLFGTIQRADDGSVTCDYSHVPYEVIKEKILEINPNYDVGIYRPYNMDMLLAFVP